MWWQVPFKYRGLVVFNNVKIKVEWHNIIIFAIYTVLCIIGG